MGVLGMLALLLLAISCDDMNDIQSKFSELEEQTYLGKVDSVVAYPGFGRSKITWYISADPKIEKTVIYWNMRTDSIVKDFVREVAGVQKDSIIVENLPVGSTLFEFRNINSRGESSLYTVATITTWGPDFAEGLSKRSIKSQEFDYASSTFDLSLSPTFTGDSVVYSEIQFTDVNGDNKHVKIDRDSTSVTLKDYPDGGEFQFRTVFFLPTGLDTVYTAYETFIAPRVIFENGEKLTIGSGLESTYFDHQGAGLYEWNSAGDLIEYGLNEDGTFSQSNVFPALVSRTNYRVFFHYDDNKFILVGHDKALTVNQLVNGALSVVGKNPLGLGFSFPAFIPAKGFFYSVEASGTVRTWMATNYGTFGNPNGSTVSKDFKYPLYTLFNFSTILAVDAEGYLWAIPISPTGLFGSKRKIGSGWNRFNKLVAVGNIVLGMDENGDFWKFDFDTTRYWVVDNP